MNIDKIHINSTENSVPHIINFSVLNIKPEVMQHALEEEDIYISTKTACSKDHSDSLTLTELGFDHSICGYSLRISLSYKTKEEDINRFVDILKAKIDELSF